MERCFISMPKLAAKQIVRRMKKERNPPSADHSTEANERMAEKDALCVHCACHEADDARQVENDYCEK